MTIAEQMADKALAEWGRQTEGVSRADDHPEAKLRFMLKYLAVEQEDFYADVIAACRKKAGL